MREHLKLKREGLYCKEGDFFIDPLKPVPLALITHAHGDHARPGSGHYITSFKNEPLLRKRVGKEAKISTYSYGEEFALNKTLISFHPAGHILGSSQIRIEGGDLVSVVSGDYKRAKEGTADPFELLECDIFFTESTFGLPIYHWPTQESEMQEIFTWWQKNAKEGFASLLFCYALGKAQHLLYELKQNLLGPVYAHGSILNFNEIYKTFGFDFSFVESASELPKKHDFSSSLILSPPSGFRSLWMNRFLPCKTAFASGWSLVRGNRRRSGYDRGFVFSDHADWDGLLQTIEETKAKKVFVMHGYEETLSRYLLENKGIDARPLHNALFVPNEEE